MKRRGLRRYYRDLAHRAPVLDLLRNPTRRTWGYDYEHIHLNGYVLTRRKAVKAHLEALFNQFEIAKEHVAEWPEQFQMWGYVCFQRDFGCQIMLYVHSPNGDADDYPARFGNFRSTPTLRSSEILRYLQAKAGEGFTIQYSINCDQEPEILITLQGVGESISSGEAKDP